jgi:hypothetical protein
MSDITEFAAWAFALVALALALTLIAKGRKKS